MKLVLSGEGKGDIGQDAANGPIAEMLFSLLRHEGVEWEEAIFIHRAEVIRTARQEKPKRTPRSSEQRDTAYSFMNARAFARVAKKHGGVVVGFLFCDSDKNDRDVVCASIMDGFRAENFVTGIPVVPMPKSEAWILCAVKNQYQYCGKLENAPKSDKSPNSLKKQLKAALPDDHSAECLADKVRNGEIDATRIDMPSFNACRERLQEVTKQMKET